ncbi:MAG: GtrA family protein [Candidatus Paceibacterota bacterium]
MNLIKRFIVPRYLIGGACGAATNVFFLFLLVDVFGVWYLQAAVWSFLISWLVSFLLQKYWTFQNYSTENGVLQKQATLFFAVSFLNLGINTLLMYIFVDFFQLWYLLAQVFSSALIAISSFFIYKHFVFKEKTIAPQSL